MHLDLLISAGENIAIVGENGAGKTTLIKLLMGLLKPDEGQILINGYAQSAYNILDFYELFAPIFQDQYAFKFTIREAIVQGGHFDEEKYIRVLKESRVDIMIQQFPQGDATPYVKEVNFDAVQLSGGQMQKLKLAQALYKDAPVLVLDEPTAALDPIAESKVYESYERFSEGKVSIFISHRLASTRFCDRILYLEHGAVTEAGTHGELMELEKKYFKLFETQAHYYQETAASAEVEEELVEQGGVI